MLQFATGQVAQPGAGATLCSSFYNMPNRFRGQSIAPEFVQAAYPTENGAGADFSGGGPRVNRQLYQRRDRDCTDVLSFADQIRK